MQRLGILKLIVSHASAIPLSSLSSVSDTLTRCLAKTMVVGSPIIDRTYFAKGMSGQTLRARPASDSGDTSNDRARIELQDLYLSDTSMPSTRGRLGTPDDFLRFPQFAAALNLIRSDTAALLARGQLLTKLTPQPEIDAFYNYSEEVNPFLLTTSQSLLLLLTMLESDASVIPALYSRPPAPQRRFKDMEAGDFLPEILCSVVRAIPTRNLSVTNTLKLKGILDTAEAISARKGVRFGKTVREQNITPRLEPFVDLGILRKPKPYAYEYELTEHGAVFINGISGDIDVQNKLEQHFFALATKLYGLELDEINDLDVRLRVLHQAWRSLHNNTRYSSIDETGIYASIMGVEQGLGFIELKTTWDSLYEARDLDRELLRLNIDRNGKITSLRFLKEPN